LTDEDDMGTLRLEQMEECEEERGEKRNLDERNEKENEWKKKKIYMKQKQCSFIIN